MVDAEKVLKMKGVIESTGAPGKTFENKKEELEYELSLGSSFLLDQLNGEEVSQLNTYI